MSFRLIPLAWDAPLPAMKKLVLLKLVDCANDDGSSCRPSVGSIVRDCGCSERFVRNVLREFRERGILWIEKEAHGRLTTEYRIDVSRLKGVHRVQGCTPCRGAPDDQKGCTPCTPPLKDPSKEKKALTRIDEVLASEEVQEVWRNQRPDLIDREALRAEAVKWDRRLRSRRDQPADPSAYFAGWLENKAPKASAPAERPPEPTPVVPQCSTDCTEADVAAWQAISQRLAATIGDKTWRVWLGPENALHHPFANGLGRITVGSPFAAQKVANNFGDLIRTYAEAEMAAPVEIEIEVSNEQTRNVA